MRPRDHRPGPLHLLPLLLLTLLLLPPADAGPAAAGGLSSLLSGKGIAEAAKRLANQISANRTDNERLPANLTTDTIRNRKATAERTTEEAKGSATELTTQLTTQLTTEPAASPRLAETAECGEFPFLVVVRLRRGTSGGGGGDEDGDGDEDEPSCAGSAVAADRVLTAAGCVTDSTGKPRRAADLQVLVGGLAHAVSRVRVHGRFDPASGSADLALLEVDGLADSATVRTIRWEAPPLTPGSRGQEGYLLGWGPTGAEAGGGCQPLYTVANVTECAFPDPADVLCAGGGAGDPCLGEAGAPLVWGRMQLALVSRPALCGSSPRPAALTPLHPHRGWLDATLEGGDRASAGPALAPALLLVAGVGGHLR